MHVDDSGAILLGVLIFLGCAWISAAILFGAESKRRPVEPYDAERHEAEGLRYLRQSRWFRWLVPGIRETKP